MFSYVRIIKSRMLRLTGYVAHMDRRYRALVETGEENNPLGRPTRRRADNIRMNLREVVWDVMDSIDLAQDRDQWRALVNTVMNLMVP
jgi:hypothetical protein